VILQRNGELVSYTTLGAALGVAVPTVVRWVGELEREGHVLLMEALPGEAAKNRLRKPRIYVREAAVEALSAGHGLGPIGELIEREKGLHPSSRLYHSTNRDGRGLDLVVDREGFRFGVIHVPVGVARRRRLTPLRRAREQGLIRRGFALHRETAAFFLYRDVIALPRMVFLGAFSDWTARKMEPHILMHWCNNAFVTDFGKAEPTIAPNGGAERRAEKPKNIPFYVVRNRE
jgi:hypothetical protein